MKKNRIAAYSILALAAVFTFSCKDKSAFVISGTLTNPGSVKTVYLMEADSTQVKVVDSTNIGESGKFEFKHQAPYADLYKLRIGGSIFDLIAKNGDAIEFSTDVMDDKHTYKISGSDESDKIQQYNNLSNLKQEKENKILAEYQEKAQGRQSDSLFKLYFPIYQKNEADYSESIIKLANEDKKSLAGFYAMTSLRPDAYEKELIAYADAIKDNNTDNPAVKQFVKQMEKVKPVSIGHKAPDFTINSIDNKPIKLSDYKGKYVMLDFWASWCGPCRQENPNVVKQYAIFKSKGLNILGISLDKDIGAWKKAIADDKITWAQASDLQDFKGPTEALYQIDSIPSNFIIDPNGVIVAKNVTGPALEDFLNKTFK